MHILIDLQGAQTSGSRHRGIGNYSEALALQLARLAKGKHRVSLLLNAAFSDTIDPIRHAFTGLIEPTNFFIWEPLSPCSAHEPANTWRRKACERLYAAFVASIHADILLVTSLFEGYTDDAITAIPQQFWNTLTAVVLFDLIPKIYPKPYLENPLVSAWYHGRLAQARQADLLLAISASSAQEAIDHLDRKPAQVINISSAVDSRFHVIKVSPREEENLRARYGLHRRFVMYTGGIDYRKNIEGLLAAYAALPLPLRIRHQLAVVCSITEPAQMKLAELATQLGLADDDVVFTGYVPDSDLVTLYNLCTLFVFPSWHEGFGLPALEAMACGAPTLASNRSSLPEVVGRPDALFDPFDYENMARAIERGLTDEAYRASLKEHGLSQARKFSWAATAGRALEALEALQLQRIGTNAFAPIQPLRLHTRRLRLAFVSPLQPAKSGIADYSAELLPALAAHYDIDVIVEQADLVSDRWVLGNAFQRSVAWFEINAKKYDRIIYQIGNSQFHQHMLGLLEKFPGVVVLHDFFLSGLQAHQDTTGIAPGAWARELLRAHGWSALKERFEAKDIAKAIYAWPCNLDVLQRALGVIVHAAHSRELAERWYGLGYARNWIKVPLLRTPAANTNRTRARATLNLKTDDILVCSFGFIGKSKLNHLLIQAWLASDLAQDERCHLIFVGHASGEYGEQIQRRCEAGHGRIHITGWTNDEIYQQYLSAADIAVQLRTLSRGETSAAVLDCMNYGIATIVNAHGSMAELPRDAVWMLDDGFTTEALAEALNSLRRDSERRSTLAAKARAHIRAEHLPSTCADQYASAIERFYARAEQGLLGLARSLSALGQPQDNADLLKLAELAAQIFPPPRPAGRQLLIDISSLQTGGMNSSVSQIVSKVLHYLLQNPPDGVRIEPVYATTEQFYRYARNFTATLLGLGDVPLDDAPIFAQPKDVFWGLDFAPELVSRHQASLISLRLRGTRIVFSAHDLLPILHPELSTACAAETHSKWLRALAIVSDGIISASSTVSTELKDWLTLFGPRDGHTVKLGWARPGTDVVRPTSGKSGTHLTPQQEQQLAAISQCPAFLVLGALEPSKAQAQAMAAFELLWQRGERVNLVFVGEDRGHLPHLVARLRNHPLRERHLFWVDSIDDAMLEQLYRTSACLLVTSLGDGYSASIYEAAKHRLPILARDIPVFREMAGEHASYFSGSSPRALANSVDKWLEAHRTSSTVPSEGIAWMDWAKATEAMLGAVLYDGWQDHWHPEPDDSLVARYWGSDARLSSQVGKRIGTAIWSTGRTGFLLHGPYLALKQGDYVVELHGTIGALTRRGARVDVCISGGREILVEKNLLGGAIESEPIIARLGFTLDKPCENLEIRVEVDQFSDISVNLVEIRRSAAAKVDQPSKNGQIDPFLDHAISLSNQSRPVLSYWATHDALKSEVGFRDGRSLHTTGRAGHLVFGPYANLASGFYTVKFAGRIRDAGNAWLDVVCDKGATRLAKWELAARMQGDIPQLMSLEFTLDHFATDLEIRVYVTEDTDMQLDGLVVEDRQSRPKDGNFAGHLNGTIPTGITQAPSLSDRE